MQTVLEPPVDSVDVNTPPIRAWSLEVLPRAVPDLAAAGAQLARDTAIYLPAPCGQGLATTLEAARAVHELGLEPVPHIVVRNFGARGELRDFLSRLVHECGVGQVLLVAGDSGRSAGAYHDCRTVLDDGTLQHAGIRAVGLAGFPEGHPHLTVHAGWHSLSEKIEIARAQGLAVHIVTQFSFAPRRLIEFCSRACRELPEVPVWVGIAGPTDPLQLLHYARLCGVNASRRALAQLGLGIARLAMHTDPGDQVALVKRYVTERPQCRVAGIHVFGFGGVARTVEWIETQRERIATA